LERGSKSDLAEARREQCLVWALRQVKRNYPDSPFLFVTERGGPMTEATVRKLVARSGKAARIGYESSRTSSRNLRAGLMLAVRSIHCRFSL
jgi:site-specific recombinase XerD